MPTASLLLLLLLLLLLAPCCCRGLPAIANLAAGYGHPSGVRLHQAADSDALLQNLQAFTCVAAQSSHHGLFFTPLVPDDGPEAVGMRFQQCKNGRRGEESFARRQ